MVNNNKKILNYSKNLFKLIGFFDDNINQLCLACQSPCVTCDGSTKNDCKSCNTSH
jgi:hypothetical protein